ncbi:hypothetical protein D9Q98_008908 [Chlorella vulgaris]|uniref:Zinc finger PHD-type domain-containing protein n=1 Tax=Chlorella vulgaris TaxID=3077 RepID=A0A9D4YTD5_CHLVU|nr:hypothetical protein D9Q98_008908 [Chlorella vulgaris]
MPGLELDIGPMHMDPCGTLLKRQDKEDEGTKGGTDGTSKRKLGSPSVAVSLPHKRGRPLSGVHVPGPQQQQQHVAQSAAAAAAAAAPATPAARSVCQAQLQQHRPSRIGTALHSPELSPSVVAAAEAHGPLLSELSLDTQRLQAVLQQQVAHQRAADGGEGAHFAALWRQAQGVVLQKTLRLLVRQLEAMPPPSTDNAKPTAGVSYVCPTESRQSGASGFSRLPHLVYQPPGLKEVSSDVASAFLETLSGSATAAAVLPMREENDMKRYLLLPSQRRDLLQQGGHLLEAPLGASGIESLLQDRSFVCLHYHLDSQGTLHPVDISPTASTGNCCNGCTAERHTVEQSNVQLGMMVRKGVGGTCPLRAAARRLGSTGLLSMLLDDSPQLLSVSNAPQLVTPQQVAMPHAAPCTLPKPAAAAFSAAGAASQLAAGCSSTEASPSGIDESVSRSLAGAFLNALVDAAKADEVAATSTVSVPPLAAAAAAAAVACPEPCPADHAAKKDDHVPQTTATTPSEAPAGIKDMPLKRPAVLQSTAAMEALLQQTAAELRAAEVAAEAAGDQEMPDFEAEDAAAEAAEAAASDASTACDAQGSCSAAKSFAVDLAGEEGVEELLHEIQEQQQQQSCPQQPAEAGSTVPDLVSPAAPLPASPTALSSGCSGTPAPLMSQVHPRLSTSTLSCRLELYVAQATWERLSRAARNALHTAVRRLERALLRELAKANQRRLLDFCRRLDAALDPAVPSSGAVARLLPGQRMAPEAAADGRGLLPGLDHNAAIVLAASCLLASDSCCSGGRPTSLQVPWPFYLIATRDSFTHHLLPIETRASVAGRQYLRAEYYLRAQDCPVDYHAVLAACKQPGSSVNASQQGTSPRPLHVSEAQREAVPLHSSVGSTPAGLLPIGVTTYTQLFSNEELAAIEAESDGVDARSQQGLLPDSCYHRTVARGGNLKRSKYFFGARYLWTRDQLAEPDSKVAGGVRIDVPTCPAWMRRQVEAPLVAASLVEPSFVDSIALNMYHDGSEGIQSHMDDAQRFSQPILSLRLFSDSRLSFGTQLYGYTNGSFCIPLPRGCVMVMEQGGYAANGLKHCVRPTDMAGKSAGMILRQINPTAWKAAEQLHLEETCAWLRCLSLNSSARAEALLAQRSAAGGRAVGAARQPRVPAAERREIWRAMQDLIRSVERQDRQEKLEDVTAQLTLLSALRKVEAADRLGINLCGPNAMQHDKEEAGEHGGNSTKGDTASVFSLIDDLISWVERPHAGLMPREQHLGASRAKRRGPRSAAQEVGRALQHIVRAVEEEDREERLQVAQVVFSMARCVEAAAAREDGGCTASQPTYTLLPLLHMGVTESAAALLPASMVKAQATEAVVPAARQREMEAKVAAVYLAGLELPAPCRADAGAYLPVLSSPRASGGSHSAQKRALAAAAAAGGPDTMSRSFSVSRAPMAVCFACCEGVPLDAAGDLWACEGPCRRTFHPCCQAPAAGGMLRRCNECFNNSHPCFGCGGAPGSSGTVKCSMGQCSRYWHWGCLTGHPLTKVSATGRSAKCPLHYCAACGASGNGVPMVQCLRCPNSWHVRCRPPAARVASRKFVVCPAHVGGQRTEQQAGSQQQQQQLESACEQRQRTPAYDEMQQPKRHKGSQPAGGLQVAADTDGLGSKSGELPLAFCEPLRAYAAASRAPAATELPAASSSRSSLTLVQADSLMGQTSLAPQQQATSPQQMRQGSTAVAPLSPARQHRPAGAQPPLRLSLHQHLDLDALHEEPQVPRGQHVQLKDAMSPRVALQPAWQTRLASRAELDYGEL